MWGMTDTFATPPAPESPPPVSGRLDASDAPWPLRPWIMAAICAGAGLIFHLLVDRPYNAQGSAWRDALAAFVAISTVVRSEEHTSELQSLMRISYAVFCLKKKKHKK